LLLTSVTVYPSIVLGTLIVDDEEPKYLTKLAVPLSRTRYSYLPSKEI
jgi:hypothetical protein